MGHTIFGDPGWRPVVSGARSWSSLIRDIAVGDPRNRRHIVDGQATGVNVGSGASISEKPMSGTAAVLSQSCPWPMSAMRIGRRQLNDGFMEPRQ